MNENKLKIRFVCIMYDEINWATSENGKYDKKPAKAYQKYQKDINGNKIPEENCYCLVDRDKVLEGIKQLFFKSSYQSWIASRLWGNLFKPFEHQKIKLIIAEDMKGNTLYTFNIFEYAAIVAEQLARIAKNNELTHWCNMLHTELNKGCKISAEQASKFREALAHFQVPYHAHIFTLITDNTKKQYHAH